MNHFPHIIKNARSFLFIKTALIALVFMSACKNDDDDNDIPKEPFPVFGTCKAVAPKGNFNLSDPINGTFDYETIGGGKIAFSPIVINQGSITITHKNYPNFKIEFWGITDIESKFSGNHENLNGKHIKNRVNVIRTIIFPDDAKITMVSDGDIDPMLYITIYEGNEIHHFNFGCNKLEYSAVNSKYAKQIEEAEADGETSTFEFTETGLLFLNIYTENVAGQKIEERIPLGELFNDIPSQVGDHFDDPRLPHT